MWGLIRNEALKLIKSKKFIILCFVLIAVFMYANISTQNDIKSLDPEIRRMNNGQMITNLSRQLETDKKLSKEDKLNIENQIKRLTEENMALTEEMIASVRDWRKNTEKKIQTLKEQKKDINAITNNNVMENLNAQIIKFQYYLDNDMIPEKDYKIYSFSAMLKVMDTISTLLIPVFIVFLSADVMSGEYSNSTIKLLLSKPVSRKKIVVSKYLTHLLIIIAIIVLAEIANFMFLGLKFEFGNIKNPVIVGTKYVFNSNKNMCTAVLNSSYLWTVGKVLISAIGLQIFFIAATSAFVILISIISASNVSSLIISFVLNVLLSLTTFLIPSQGLRTLYPILLTSYSNEPQLITGQVVNIVNNPAVNMKMGIIMMSLYTIVSLALSLTIFSKKDILV
ncbi:hypothetical protein HMPREF1982_02447 [Clostridiales bacterium oral taxon 876 str. F0540]|nr:hypothetical protein HMPREF1982_02447 [Clostridiales bacterium oral taxon 876 str. F0540]